MPPSKKKTVYQHFSSPLARMQGFTLLEVMVASTLSLILLTALLTALLASRQSYNTNEALARLQENYRFTDIMIRQNSSLGGLEPLTSTLDIFNNGASTATLNTASSADNTSPTPDTVALNLYFTDGRDCDGSPITSSWGTNTFTVNTASNTLTCNGQTMAEGVSNLQATYGVDSDDDGNANYFVALGSVSSPPQVIAVRMTLEISDEYSVRDALSPRTFTSTITFPSHTLSNSSTAFASWSSTTGSGVGEGVMIAASDGDNCVGTCPNGSVDTFCGITNPTNGDFNSNMNGCTGTGASEAQCKTWMGIVGTNPSWTAGNPGSVCE